MVHPSCELYGSDRVFLESVDAFLERGWNVQVALPDSGPLTAELERRGISPIICEMPVLRKSLMSPRGLLLLGKNVSVGTVRGLRLIFKSSPDVVYVNTITIPLWPVLARIARRPVIVHVHEAEGNAPKWLRAALAFPLRFATTVVANSRYSAGVYAESVPSLKNKSEVIYNGVPLPETATRARAAISGPFRVLYVGRLSYRKGVDVAVAAVGELRDRGLQVHLDIVGGVYPGGEAYDESLRQTVRALGLESRVTFHGFHQDVSAFHQKCDAAVVTSRLDEPFGNTAVEAVLAGRPLVVSDTSGLREAAADYPSAQFVAPDNAKALADALLKVAENWDSYSAMAADDRELAASKHGSKTYRSAIADVVIRTAGLTTSIG